MKPSPKTLEMKIGKFACPMNIVQSPRYSHHTLNCILGFLVLKKMCEVDENAGIDWQQLAQQDSGICDDLNKTVLQLVEDQPDLRDWFYGLDFNLSFSRDETKRNGIWKEIISEFVDVELTNNNELGPGGMYELCLTINQMWFGPLGYEPPVCVTRLETELINPSDKSSIYDPFCTCGTSLVVTSHTVREKIPDGKIRLFAQTISECHRLTIYLNLLLTDNEFSKVVNGDVIRDPGFTSEDHKLSTFQRIIGTLPSGIDDWGERTAHYDGFSRFIYGVPPCTQGDFAYLQHCIASLHQDGMMAIAVPPSVLFKERSEGSIRQGIIKDDLIEAVILLPKKLYRDTSMNYAILVVNRKKPSKRNGKILFIDASSEFHPGRVQNVLLPKNIQKIVDAFHNFTDVDGYCRVCSIGEIEKNRFLLDVGRYVKEKPTVPLKIDLRAAIKEIDHVHMMQIEEYERVRQKAGEIVEYLECTHGK